MMNVDEMVGAATNGNKMSEEINQDRRRFLGVAFDQEFRCCQWRFGRSASNSITGPGCLVK